ncbi:MAG: hypothetical protein KKG47_05165 [Proteobacteria bacterium]|nr:hypothetical protein [Pseudomonadota bacterium]MBU1739814.1 hypothetical protein [Pseudomonadota bacterium]
MIWIPKCRKKVLNGEVTIRSRDIFRQIAMEMNLI